MQPETQYKLSDYTDIESLCGKEHVMLVQNTCDGQLYVKKKICKGSPEVYRMLQKNPVKNTPVVYDIFAPEEGGDGNFTVIEEYISGKTLADILTESGEIPEAAVTDITIQLCRVLMDLHAMKPAIIHRDIKPSNVFICTDGSVKLIDFDAAKIESPAGKTGNRDTVLLGTAGFAAPEQYGFSASSPQTDIYAVGVIMNLLISKKLPSEKIADGRFGKVIRKCLELNPKDRYGDVQELYNQLKQMKKIRAEWLPPGFRTLHPLKMLLAFIGYGLPTLLILRTDDSGFDSRLEYRLFQVGVLLIFYLSIFFWGDYMGMQKYFPLMKSRRRWLRAAGLVLMPVVFFWVIIIAVTIIENTVQAAL